MTSDSAKLLEKLFQWIWFDAFIFSKRVPIAKGGIQNHSTELQLKYFSVLSIQPLKYQTCMPQLERSPCTATKDTAGRN